MHTCATYTLAPLGVFSAQILTHFARKSEVDSVCVSFKKHAQHLLTLSRPGVNRWRHAASLMLLQGYLAYKEMHPLRPLP